MSRTHPVEFLDLIVTGEDGDRAEIHFTTATIGVTFTPHAGGWKAGGPVNYVPAQFSRSRVVEDGDKWRMPVTVSQVGDAVKRLVRAGNSTGAAAVWTADASILSVLNQYPRHCLRIVLGEARDFQIIGESLNFQIEFEVAELPLSVDQLRADPTKV